MRRKVALTTVLVTLLAIALPMTAQATTGEDQKTDEFFDQVADIYYSPNSKLENYVSEDGKEKTQITVERTVPNFEFYSTLEIGEKLTTKEALSVIVEENVDEVMSNRKRSLTRAEGDIQDSRRTAKGIVYSRLTYYFAPIQGSGINYYGIRSGWAMYSPASGVSSSARSITIGQVGGNAIYGTVTFRDSANVSNTINNTWFSLGRGWVADGQRVAALYGVCSTTAYGSFTSGGVTDRISCTISAF